MENRPLQDIENDEKIESVHRKVAQARGSLKAALEELDGEGNEVRDKLAGAFASADWSYMALSGEKHIREED